MTMIFNGGHELLVVDWSKPAVLPGEGFETDRPESFGEPWTTDPEKAQEAARAYAWSTGGFTPALPSEPPSGPQDAPQAPPEDGPALHLEPNGELVNPAGEVVGHFTPDTPAEPGPTTPGGQV